MKTNFYKKNPKRLLGYLMAFAMVLFSVNINAQCSITASGTSVDESCAGACDGSVSVNVSGSACKQRIQLYLVLMCQITLLL